MSEISLFYPTKDGNGVKRMSLAGVEPATTIELRAVDDTVVATSSNTATPLFGMLTQLKIDKSEAASITPTIGNHLFLYVGGESYYTITASGLAFNRRCDKKKSEINDLIDYYSNNNVKKTGKFGKILIGDKVYKGYLIKFGSACGIENDAYFTFNLTFLAVAEE